MQSIRTTAALILSLLALSVFAQDQQKAGEPQGSAVVVPSTSLMGGKFTGVLVGWSGRNKYEWWIQFESIQGEVISGMMAKTFPECRGPFAVAGTVVADRLKLAASGSHRCEQDTLDLVIQNGGKTLTGKLISPSGKAIDVSLNR